MRLAFLTHEPFYPPSGGGSAEAVYLVEELVRRGHEVHLFCPSFADAGAVANRFGVVLHEFRRWEMGRYASMRNIKYLLYPRELQRMVLEAADTTTFDLVLSQHTISAVAAGRLRSALRLPVVMNFLDFLTGFMETWPAWIAPPILLKRLKNYEISLPSRYEVDGVMTVSQPLADTFANAGYPISRLCPIFYGYDSGKFPLRDTAPPAEHPVVVMHGSFDKHHLGPIALNGMTRIHEKRPNVEFRFVGRRTAVLDAFVRRLRGSAPGIKMQCTGFIPYNEVGRQLAAATVGVVPYEASSGTHCAFVAKAVEYLGVGLPVVSTRLQNLAHYFGGEPRVRFCDFGGGSFADAVLQWLESPSAGTIDDAARAASERVKETLDWRSISRNAIDFVEKTRDEFR